MEEIPFVNLGKDVYLKRNELSVQRIHVFVNRWSAPLLFPLFGDRWEG